MKKWIGVDLDDTLAVNDEWRGYYHIGDPYVSMVQLVKSVIESGIEVKIFTARAAHGPIEPIKEWCKKHIGQELDVTCAKDMNCIEIWDDRARQVKDGVLYQL